MNQLNSWTRFVGLLSISLFGALSSVGCGSDDASLGGNNEACNDVNWRKPTDGAVVCPGANGCLCGAGEVCCATVGSTGITGSSCSALADCKGPAIGCDGPEDCPSGQVCCLLDNSTGGGSNCRDPKDCFGINEIPMCRAQEHCDGIKECTPAKPGTLLEGLVGGCTL